MDFLPLIVIHMRLRSRFYLPIIFYTLHASAVIADSPAWGQRTESNREWVNITAGTQFDRKSVRRIGNDVRWTERALSDGAIYEVAINCSSREYSISEMNERAGKGWSKPQFIRPGSVIDQGYQAYCQP